MAGKYSNEELGNMAREAIAARHQGETKWLELIMVIALNTALSPDEIEAKIYNMAENY